MSASWSGRRRGVPCGHSDARQLRRDCGGTAAGLLAAGISRWTGRRRGDRAALAVVTGTGPADREHAARRDTATTVTTSRRNERILPSRTGAPATWTGGRRENQADTFRRTVRAACDRVVYSPSVAEARGV